MNKKGDSLRRTDFNSNKEYDRFAKKYRQLSNKKYESEDVAEQGMNTDKFINENRNNFNAFLSNNAKTAMMAQELSNVFSKENTFNDGGPFSKINYGYNPSENVALSNLLDRSDYLQGLDANAMGNLSNALTTMDFTNQMKMKTKLRPEYKDDYREYNKAYKQGIKNYEGVIPTFVHGGPHGTPYQPFSIDFQSPEPIPFNNYKFDEYSPKKTQASEYGNYILNRAFDEDGKLLTAEEQDRLYGEPLSYGDFIDTLDAKNKALGKASERLGNTDTSKEEELIARAEGKLSNKKTNPSTSSDKTNSNTTSSYKKEKIVGNANDEDTDDYGNDVPQLGVLYPNTGLFGRRGKAPLFYNPRDTYLENSSVKQGIFGPKVKMQFTHYGPGMNNQTPSAQRSDARLSTEPAIPESYMVDPNQIPDSIVYDNNGVPVDLSKLDNGSGMWDDRIPTYGNGGGIGKALAFGLGSAIGLPLVAGGIGAMIGGRRMKNQTEQLMENAPSMIPQAIGMMSGIPMMSVGGGTEPIADTYVKSQKDWKGIGKKGFGPALDFAAMIGRSITEPNIDKQIMDLTSADNMFTPSDDVERGMNTFNQMGVVDPYGVKGAPQFTGMMSKYGGEKKYKEGGSYEMSEDEIQEFIAAGGKIEYLD